MQPSPRASLTGSLKPSMSPSTSVNASPRGSVTMIRTPETPKSRLTSSLSRPDDVSALGNIVAKGKNKPDEREDIKANAQVVRGPGGDQVAEDTKSKKKMLTTPCGETSISKKEEALEQIMCAEAFAGFERMARHQLSRHTANRTAVDPGKVPLDMDYLAQIYLDGSDVAEPDSDSDEEAIMRHEFDQWHEGAGDDPSLRRTWGLRLGFGFTDPMKDQIAQDRIFASRCGQYSLIGIVNSHGCQDVGPYLASFISEELPRSFFKSPWLTQENDPCTALSHAFDRTHRKAIKQLDCRLTGACCTVLLLDETCVYIAHVGNCRAVLAVPDPSVNAEKYHFIPVPLTVDHKLSVRTEFDRILEYGGEVRRCVNDNVHRLFFKDDYVPGLTLTRGIGHRMAHPIGVTHIPSIQLLQRHELHRDAFIILGSGGVWHTMSERGVVNWISKHFADPSQASRSLGEECQRRWKDPSTRLKAYVQNGAGESFSSMIISPALECEVQGATSQAPRQFQLGPHDTKVARRPWKEVRQVNWKGNLEVIMNGGGGNFE